MSTRTYRVLLALNLSLFAALVLFLLATCVGPPWYYSAKYAPSDSTERPSALPAELIAETQTEPHTCGLHTLSSIYRAYGLDAKAHNLRFRLGTDKPAVNFIADSTGSIHPDMLRVLRQDGFDTEILRASGKDTADLLAVHLRRGHVAAALTKPADEFHWVALSGAENNQLLVCDSLEEKPYPRELEPYLRESVYSIILIAPQSESYR